MAWSTHTAEVYPTVILGDRGSLELIAEIAFDFRPGTEATRDSPAEGPAADVLGCRRVFVDLGDGKRFEIKDAQPICEWIAATVDKDSLIAKAIEDERDRADEAADAKYQERRDERIV